MRPETVTPEPTIASEIDRYLHTGETDPWRSAWGGISRLPYPRQARDDLRAALVVEVERRAAGVTLPPPSIHGDLRALTRSRTEPMIRGLFPRAEQDLVLSMVEASVVLLTPESIASVLREVSFDRSAWNLANLYLGSVGAELLGPDAFALVGLSEGDACYVSPACLHDEDPFADFIVHEVAHIFHNCKRERVGLPVRRHHEWLLDIDFRGRETFAYACEAFSRIVARAPRIQDRPALVSAFAEAFRPSDDRADPGEVADILAEAADRRNGWKVILARCAPPQRSR